MKILVTGFEPFGGEKVNPAYEVVKLLPKSIEGAEITTLKIPVVFRKGPNKIEEAIKKENPDIVLSIGQYGGASSIHVEKVGINILDARIPDNEGNQPVDEIIKKDGKTAYFSKLPVRAIRDRMRSSGIPSSISYTAGAYVCNDVLYEVLYMCENVFPGLKSGFIHVPFAPIQVIDKPEGTPSMSLEMMEMGLELAIEEIVKDNK